MTGCCACGCAGAYEKEKINQKHKYMYIFLMQIYEENSMYIKSICPFFYQHPYKLANHKPTNMIQL